MGTRASFTQLSPESGATAAGSPLRRLPVQGSVILGLMPAQPQPRAAWAYLLPVSETSPAQARAGTELFLAHCPEIQSDFTDTAVLLVSELVTNAYRAMLTQPLSGIACIELSLRLFDDNLLIEVIDSSERTPIANLANNAEAENWRGLAVVEALSQEWGYFWHLGRKIVYCTLPISLGRR